MNEVTFPKNRPELRLQNVHDRKNSLEFKTITFTVVLYVFICVALLTVHYAAPYMTSVSEVSSESSTETVFEGSSSGSPHNPK